MTFLALLTLLSPTAARAVDGPTLLARGKRAEEKGDHALALKLFGWACDLGQAEGCRKATPQPAARAEGFPGAEGASRANDDGLSSAKSAFTELMTGLFPVVRGTGDASFRLNGCTRWKPSEIAGFLLLQRPLARNLAFK